MPSVSSALATLQQVAAQFALAQPFAHAADRVRPFLMAPHHDAFIAQLAHAAAAPRECHAGRHSSCRSAQAISFCDWSVLSAVLS